MSWERYDAASGPLEERIKALQADIDALSTVEAQDDAAGATIEQIKADFADPDVPIERKRTLIRSAAPHGIVVLVCPPGANNQRADIRGGDAFRYPRRRDAGGRWRGAGRLAARKLSRTPAWGSHPTSDWQPLLRWYSQTSDMGPQILDRIPRAVAGQRMLQAHREFVRPLRAEHQLAIPVAVPQLYPSAFVAARPIDDFSDDDVAFATTLQSLLTAALLQRHVLATAGRAGPAAGSGELTDRQLSMLLLLATGATAQAIGRQLTISPRTVQKHLENINRRLGASDRVTAIGNARDRGILL